MPKSKKTNIYDNIIETTPNQIVGIGVLNISGGKPTLALDKLEKIITFIIKKETCTVCFIENIKRYKENKYFYGFRNINNNLFCKVNLNKRLTVF